MTGNGFSLVELIVAMTILSLGVLVLAAAGTYAQRNFADAEAIDRAAYVAAGVLDSLMRVPEPAAGERADRGVSIRWTTATDPPLTVIRADVEVMRGGRSHRIVFHASRADDDARPQ